MRRVRVTLGELEKIALIYLTLKKEPVSVRNLRDVVREKHPFPYKSNLVAYISTWNAIEDLANKGLIYKKSVKEVSITDLGRTLIDLRIHSSVRR